MGARLGLVILKLWGRLPLWVLHVEATLLAFVMRRIVGYRRRVISENLQRVFKTKSHVSAAYRNLCDVMVESLKLFSISEAEVRRRTSFVGLDHMHKLYDKGKNVIFVGTHMANWEIFSLAMPLSLKHNCASVYKKLNNPVFDAGVKASREAMGMSLLEMAESKSWMAENTGEGKEPVSVIMIFDQKPVNPNKAWWTPFLGVETAWYVGLETFAKRYDAEVVFIPVRRKSRGHYEMEFVPVTDGGIGDAPRGEVLGQCIGLLEKEIEAAPGDWLWSHKRWKHSRPEGCELHPRTSLCLRAENA